MMDSAAAMYCTRCDQQFVDADDANTHTESFNHATTSNRAEQYRALMDRLDALEAKVKNLEHMLPV